MSGNQEQHFILAVWLMLFFFTVATLEQVAYALRWTPILVGGNETQTAHVLFSRIAVGMMRGMAPDGKP